MRPKEIEDFEPTRLEPETVYRLPAARLVFADHDLLQHDFPSLHDDALIDDWLITNAAFISAGQRNQSLVNTPIAISDEQTVAFRPPHYGRALIFSLAENRRSGIGTETDAVTGLLDVKGTGVALRAIPKLAPHANGLMMLGEAIREVITEKILNRIFQHSQSGYRAVPCYGVIDTGFDIKQADGTRIPAGMLVRRAHLRPTFRLGTKESSSPLVDLELDIELLLRRYGVTSIGVATIIEIADSDGETTIKYGCTPLQFKGDDLNRIKAAANFTGGRKRLEGVNIQFTKEAEANPDCAQIIDFGGFFVKESFANPIVSLVGDRLLRLGEMISPCDSRFVQPDEKIRLPQSLWGETGRIWGYEASEAELAAFVMDNPKILAFNLAREFREQKLSGEEVRSKIELFLNASIAHWD